MCEQYLFHSVHGWRHTMDFMRLYIKKIGKYSVEKIFRCHLLDFKLRNKKNCQKVGQ